MRILFYSILLLITCNLYSSDALKVLILPFASNNDNNLIGLYSTLIRDTIKSNLTNMPKKIEINEFEKEIYSKIKNEEDKNTIKKYYSVDILNKYYSLSEDINDEIMNSIKRILLSIGYNRFIPLILKDISLNDNITDYKKVYYEALNKNIDLIIYGSYFEENQRIRIIFNVIDLKLDKIKVGYSINGDSGVNVFDVIISSAYYFVKRMNEAIKLESYMINPILKEKQSRMILRDVTDKFLYLNLGISYLGTGFINIHNNNPDIIDLKSSKNIITNSINPFCTIEVFGTYRNNYHGFSFKFLLPLTYNLIPNLMMNSQVTIGYVFGFKKEFFFSWTTGIYFQSSSFYYNNNGSTNQLFYIAFPFIFTFRYMPQKYPFLFEIGTIFVPPRIPVNNNNSSGGGPIPYIISTGNNSQNNWMSPVFLELAFGYFFNKEMGIYIENVFYLFHVSFENSWQNNNNYSYQEVYGDSYGINFNIKLGIVFKGIFR